MSVFKRNSSPYYSYDFRLRGIRLSGPTYCQTRSDAERFEAAKKREVRERADAFRNPDLPFSLAAERFYQEVGQFLSAPDNTFRSLAWLGAALGNRTPLRSITNSTVAELVAKRRAEGVSPSTVNRSVVEPLRNIMRRAETVWELQVPRIEWKRHRLKEPQERVREASASEEAKLLALVPEDYRAAIRFAILTGCRRGEIVGLTWPKVSFEAREFRVTGKGDRSRTIPMTWEVVGLLRTLEGHHKTAVFTFEAQRTRDGRQKGNRQDSPRNNGGDNGWGAVIDSAGYENVGWIGGVAGSTSLLRGPGNPPAKQLGYHLGSIEEGQNGTFGLNVYAGKGVLSAGLRVRNYEENGGGHFEKFLDFGTLGGTIFQVARDGSLGMGGRYSDGTINTPKVHFRVQKDGALSITDEARSVANLNITQTGDVNIRGGLAASGLNVAGGIARILPANAAGNSAYWLAGALFVDGSGRLLYCEADGTAPKRVATESRGTWTPRLRGSNGTEVGSYSAAGTWLSNGSSVTFNLVWSISSVGGASGALQVDNMPFPRSEAFDAGNGRLTAPSDEGGFMVSAYGGTANPQLLTISRYDAAILVKAGGAGRVGGTFVVA